MERSQSPPNQGRGEREKCEGTAAATTWQISSHQRRGRESGFRGSPVHPPCPRRGPRKTTLQETLRTGLVTSTPNQRIKSPLLRQLTKTTRCIPRKCAMGPPGSRPGTPIPRLPALRVGPLGSVRDLLNAIQARKGYHEDFQSSFLSRD